MIAACAMQCLNAHRVRIICMQCPYAMPLMPYGRPAGLLQKRIQAKISGDRSGQRFIIGRNKHALPSVCAGLLALSSLSSCSDWTRPESVEIHAPTLEEQDPELYAQYLQNLREYKESDHKMVFGWFDNSASAPAGQSDRLAALPDSLDAVVLMYPDQIDSWELDEMRDIRQDKGTRVLYTIDYATLLSDWEATLPSDGDASGDGSESTDGFLSWLGSRLDSLLPLCAEHGFDGITVWYDPVNTSHLPDAEKTLQEARQSAFESRIKSWLDSNPDKLFFLESNCPGLISETGLVENADYIVVHTESAENMMELEAIVRNTLINDVPSDRFITLVESTAPGDTRTGYIQDASGENVEAVNEVAWWSLEPESGLTKAGMGIRNIQNGYFNDTSYVPSRRAITILNSYSNR